jgi:ATP-dependent DNA helicase RecG
MKKGASGLIKNGESEKLELKPSLSQINEIVEAVSGMANAKGGHIIIGVAKSGRIIGLEAGKDTIERLSNKIVNNTDPNIYPEICTERAEGRNVITIGVDEFPDKPVLAFGRPFKRVGKSTVKISKDEYERMLTEKRKTYFDSLICEGANLEDIEWGFVTEFFIPKYEALAETKLRGDAEELLEALGCVKESKPTNAGILLFGKNPQKFFTNAFIALARYKGKDVGTERLDYKEFNGNLFQQIDNCDKYVKEHTAMMSRLHPMKVEREDIPEYPLFAIRELIVNAVVHRDYSEQRTKIITKMLDNHMEFYNPGGLPKEITPSNITRKQFSRNPAIAKVLAKVRYIEELGEGWDKIIKEHREHPLKPEMPKIDADKYSMTVTVFSTKEKFEEEKKAELNERQKKAIEFLRENGKISRKQYVALCGCSERTALDDLIDLVKKGLTERKGAGKGTYYEIRAKYAQNTRKNPEFGGRK